MKKNHNIAQYYQKFVNITKYWSILPIIAEILKYYKGYMDMNLDFILYNFYLSDIVKYFHT